MSRLIRTKLDAATIQQDLQIDSLKIKPMKLQDSQSMVDISMIDEIDFQKKTIKMLSSCIELQNKHLKNITHFDYEIVWKEETSPLRELQSCARKLSQSGIESTLLGSYKRMLSKNLILKVLFQ